jgi:hypothetical protein
LNQPGLLLGAGAFPGDLDVHERHKVLQVVNGSEGDFRFIAPLLATSIIPNLNKCKAGSKSL